ncbi:MAG: TRAP transporter permease DctQ [Candidatus Dactylopiibacterium carminicum]|uniref:TRAP transporter small permease protein n=1 Tax=Candidatus Dactylopiibacterium carminicum TaxID=857335 RepID=A0A272ETM4_9RHOO|nr:TRAP transporter small permease [Candidatus Dactylopiibacterium carminicum]KAF7599429.1 TRAP transporter small permease [Candidatus Dactylopiibacterium carminicum]PAS93455.1 MAG: TRAP transporter permease DctQ [Candidatus Dactylopiibacterium carminicum]PAS95974.1 MAG: TRAP transporter permease DctQ [Candidatus Dactylopiibacterium carminicum]PAS99437.1 MAG: TRAP transporter small permease protein [Candidatus Dactylopiibacterium carminicum]
MKILDRLEEWLIIFLIGAATTITFIAVVHRYLAGVEIPIVQDWLLGLHLGWAQELTIILFVWMAKFGAAYGVRTGIHVGVDVAINAMQPRMRGRFVLFGLLAGAFCTGVICMLGSRFVWGNGLHAAFNHWIGSTEFVPEGPVTPDLEWPTWAVYLAVPLGSALMCFRFLQVAWIFRQTGELPHHDHAAVAGMDEDEHTGEHEGART